MSWFDPKPRDLSLRLPRQLPRFICPSYINELGQGLNLLMHEGDGGRVKDSSGYGNDGTLIGGVSWIDGSWGWALGFDGVTGTVRVPHSASINPQTEITLEYWLYLRNIILDQLILCKLGATPAYESYHPSWNPGNIYFTLYFTDATFSVHSFPIAITTWYHFCLTYDTNNTIMYRNAVASAPIAHPAKLIQLSTDPLHIASFGGIINFTDAIIVLPRIYNRGLSSAEVGNHFESLRALFGI